MPKINPEILRWARETADMSVEEASQKLKLSSTKEGSAVEKLSAIEDGSVEPTRSTLLKMSTQYHRPLLVFYMSKPPQKGDRGQDFRTLPKEYSHKTDALLDALIRDVQSRQIIVRAALEDEEEANLIPFVHSMKVTDGIDQITSDVRNWIKFDINDYRNQPTSQAAFNYLRSHVEEAGVFVLLMGDLGSFHTDIGLESFRGLALADEYAPFVVINDLDSKTAWSFTLMHEFVHICLGQTGVSNINPAKRIEKFCNEVASEILLPETELKDFIPFLGQNIDEFANKIKLFADYNNISSAMVAYKLFQKEFIEKDLWQKLDAIFRQQWIEYKKQERISVKEKGGGPDYYKVQRAKVGRKLLNLVQRMLVSGTLTTTKASKVLGVRAKNVQSLLETGNSKKIGRSF
jgi:Zn-dependent peptidase ImmA (M78 family)